MPIYLQLQNEDLICQYQPIEKLATLRFIVIGFCYR